MEGQWIDVHEKLPQWTLRPDGTERALVLAKTRNNIVARANFGRFDGWQVHGVNMELDAVVAWMPLDDDSSR